MPLDINTGVLNKNCQLIKLLKASSTPLSKADNCKWTPRSKQSRLSRANNHLASQDILCLLRSDVPRNFVWGWGIQQIPL